MAGKSIPMLLVTANVGSIFEDPSVMLKVWTEEFLTTVSKLDPKFVALHCQEVGGKNYEHSMKHVEYFVRLLMSSEELRLFDKVRVYLDEDYSSAENFTALGNFYFIHESLCDVLVWDFSAMNFVPAKGKEVHSGNIESVSTKEKSKFPQDFFPECKWSRKGFLRTRWSISGSVFDFINLHLFHDATNFVAMESFPSVYSKNRRRALEHTLDRFHNDAYGTAPFFVFGDFNFRTDTQGVVKKLTEGLNPVRLQSNKSTDHTKLQYRDGTSQVILTIGKKEFSHQSHHTVFIEDNGKWMREFDRELEPFAGRLFEFPIQFQPSYPFEEDKRGATCYMQTRCPSWCDRILLSNTAKSLVSNISEENSVEYGLMGTNTCMGDHKPVYLKVNVDSDAGMIPCCCSSQSTPCFGLYLPTDARISTPHWPQTHKHGSKLDHAALSSMLLAAHCTTVSPVAAGSDNHLLLPPTHASLLHDPYTPESMETPSSSPTPSVTPQFEFPNDLERNADTSTLIEISESQQSTKEKVFNWNVDCVKSLNQSDISYEHFKKDTESEYEDRPSELTKTEELKEEIHNDIMELASEANILVEHTPMEEEYKDKIKHKEQTQVDPKNYQSTIPRIVEDICDSDLTLRTFSISLNVPKKRNIETEAVQPKYKSPYDTDTQICNQNEELNSKIQSVLTNFSTFNTEKVQNISIFQDSSNTSQPYISTHSSKANDSLHINSNSLHLTCVTDRQFDNEGEMKSQNSALFSPVESSIPSHSLKPEEVSNKNRSCCSDFSCRSCASWERTPEYSGQIVGSDESSSNYVILSEVQNKQKPLIEVSSPVDKVKFVLSVKNSCKNFKEKLQNHSFKAKISSCNKALELRKLLILNNSLSNSVNDATIDHSTFSLFRSASAPVNICSIRNTEKQSLCLLTISRTRSCGDILNMYTNKSFKNEQYAPCAGSNGNFVKKPEMFERKHNNSIPSSQSSCSRSEESLTSQRNQGRKSVSDKKCFNCCILL